MPRWGNLSIGEGLGGAKSYDPMPVVQQYAQTLQANQAKHAAEVNMLASELAKSYDPNGLRNDADRQELLKQYNITKSAAIDAENIKDPTKRAMAIADVRQQFNNLSAFTAGSKQQGVFERQTAMAHLNNPWLLDDNSAQNLKNGLGKTWNDPSVIRDASGFERGVDPSKLSSEYKKHTGQILNTSVWDNGTQTPGSEAGKKGVFVTQKRGLPMDGQGGALENTLHWVSQSKDAQKFIHDNYSNITNPDPNIQQGMRVKQFMADNGDVNGIYETSKPKFEAGYKPQDAPRPTWEQSYFMGKYGVPYDPNTKSGSNTPIYRQKLVSDMLNGVPDSGGILQDKVKADPAYDGKLLQISVGTPGHHDGTIDFIVPEKGRWGKDSQGNAVWTTTTPARTLTVDKKDPNANIKLNQLVNEITGEKVDISALQTPGGKKHVAATGQQANKVYKSSAGKQYTHAELLKAGYTEDQINQAVQMGNLK